MAIYTSYFANYSNIPEDFYLISIAQQMPTWITRNVDCIIEARPNWKLIKNWKESKISWQEFDLLYYMQVQFNLSSIRNKIPPNAVLMCWEEPFKECHRHLLAKYLNQEFNLHIEEYKF